MGCHPGARDVDMRPGRLLVGPERRYWEVGIFREQAPEIVGIGEADITLTGGDRLEDARVAIDESRIIGHPATHDGLDFGLPVTLDHGRQEPLVIDVVGGPETETIFPFGIAEG